jgi:hypothetical protein
MSLVLQKTVFTHDQGGVRELEELKDEWQGMLLQLDLDGVRVLYDLGELWSKDGKRIDCPKWFLDGMPKDYYTLDGLLYAGKKAKQVVEWLIQGSKSDELAKRAPRRGLAPRVEEAWLSVVFICLDVCMPFYQVGKSYEKRLESFKTEVKRQESDARQTFEIIQYEKVTSREDVLQARDYATYNNFEGVVIRDARRGSSIVKLKSRFTATAPYVTLTSIDKADRTYVADTDKVEEVVFKTVETIDARQPVELAWKEWVLVDEEWRPVWPRLIRRTLNIEAMFDEMA